MNIAVQNNLPADIAIFAAAVSDIKPKKFKNHKIKKDKLKNIMLIKSPDIIKNASLNKKNRPQLIIGFSLETDNKINNSLIKIESKQCDWILENQLNKKNQVFGSDFNKITLITKEKIKKFNKMTKINISKKIVEEIVKYFDLKSKS